MLGLEYLNAEYLGRMLTRHKSNPNEQCGVCLGIDICKYGLSRGWLLPAAVQDISGPCAGPLGRAGGEGDEKVLEPGNFGYLSLSSC